MRLLHGEELGLGSVVNAAHVGAIARGIVQRPDAFGVLHRHTQQVLIGQQADVMVLDQVVERGRHGAARRVALQRRGFLLHATQIAHRGADLLLVGGDKGVETITR